MLAKKVSGDQSFRGHGQHADVMADNMTLNHPSKGTHMLKRGGGEIMEKEMEITFTIFVTWWKYIL